MKRFRSASGYFGYASLPLTTFVLCLAAGFVAAEAARPAECLGYAVSNIVEEPSAVHADLDLLGDGCDLYSPSIPELRLVAEYQTDSRLHVLIQDRRGERYQVPEVVFPRPASDPHASASDSLLSFTFTQNPFSFQVLRKDSGEILFDTSGTALVFERQFLQLKTWLPRDPNIYGLGEHTNAFKVPTQDFTRTFWARDAGAVPPGDNLYSSHPIYFEHRAAGTHGVLLMTSSGMDVNLGQDEQGRNYMEYNAIGGVLDFYFLAGPGPVDVARQYAAVVGTPAMVPYWSLGFHQCKYGYQDWFEVAEVAHNYSLADIPLETLWTDIDYMDSRRIFSLDPERFPVDKMQALVQYLHGRQQHYVMMVDPAVAEYDYDGYNRGMEMNVFLKRNGSSEFRGVVWPGVTVFPDWFHPNVSAYWTEMFDAMFDPMTGVDIDGVWIDMNEPANFCNFPCDDPEADAVERGFPPEPPPLREPPRSIPGFPEAASGRQNLASTKLEASMHYATAGTAPREAIDQAADTHVDIDHEGEDLLRPPYRIRNHVPTGDLSDLTVYTDVKHHNGLWEYDVHNAYGTMMSWVTRNVMLNRRPNLRPFVLTRSTFVGAGRYVSKWLGDNVSTWPQYRMSIAGLLGMTSIYQVPMAGSDVCGFIGDATEKMCARWTTLGAFQPFFRNHADSTSAHQEFYLWPLVADAARYAISVRYRLLDYIYTAMNRQAEDGTPAISPMWFLYPEDENMYPIDLQYFYGDCILVAPVTGDDATAVEIYLPDDVFYDFETREAVRGRGSWISVRDVPFDRIPLYIRGGCVVPLRAESANTTAELRKKAFELVVAPGLDGTAAGSLYLDDGISLDGGPERVQAAFSYDGGELSTSVAGGSMESLAKAGYRVDAVTVLESYRATTPGEEPSTDREEL